MPELVARLRQVWPEPVSLRPGRYLGTRRGTSYLVLPSRRRPVLVLPAEEASAASALRRVDEGPQAVVRQRILGWAQERRLLRLLPVSRVVVEDPEDSPVIETLRAAVPDAASVVVRLGRPRHGRAVVVQALAADGRSLAFAKCAHGPRIDDLRRERALLAAVGPAPAPGLRAPRVLAFDETPDRAVLVLEALGPARTPSSRGVPVSAMQAFATRDGRRTVPIVDSPAMWRLRKGIDRLPESGSRTWLEREVDRLVDELGDEVVEIGWWHGDWVAWNMARDGDDVLLWDWEHAEDGVPLGFDHVHHLAQELRAEVGTSPAVENRWLAAARSVLAHDWGVPEPAATATLRCYLLTVNVRYLLDRTGSTDSSQRLGWSRSLVERMPNGTGGAVSR